MNKHFGIRIKEARKREKMTQEALAIEIGVTKQAISAWERGESKKIDGELLCLAATALGETAESLLHGKEDTKNEVHSEKGVYNLDSATPEDLAKIILTYQEADEIKQLALQKLSEMPSEKLAAIMKIIGD